MIRQEISLTLTLWPHAHARWGLPGAANWDLVIVPDILDYYGDYIP